MTFSLFRKIRAALMRYAAGPGAGKMPGDLGALTCARNLAFSSLGSTRKQCEAYRGHVYKCVTIIYRRALSVPLKLYIQRGERKEEIRVHPFLDLIKKPNRLMSGSFLKAMTLMHLDLTGKAFWLKTFNSLGRPVELWPLPVANFSGFLTNEAGTELLGFEFYADKGEPLRYGAEEVAYFRYPHPVNYLDGASPIQAMAHSYDLDLATRVYQRNFFQKSARPDVMLQTDQDIQPEDAYRVLSNWKRNHQGVDKAWEPAILDKGLKVKTLQASNEDIQFMGLAGWAKEDILEAYNVPEGKLGGTKNVKEGGDLAIDITFNSECILPRLRLFDEEINTSIIPHFDERLFVRHANCVPRDKEYYLEQRETNLRNGVTIINEEREKEGLKPVPWGYAPWMPKGMTQGSGSKG
jgi:HK97 family phage portal protein